MASGDKGTVGQLLLERGWITAQQLDVALVRQKELGGRLGTSLLELGTISEDLLIKVLGEQSSLPVVNLQDLHEIPAEVLELLPAKVAVRHEVIPFRKGRSRVDVAARDEPDIPTLDELSFVLGRRVIVHIANEVRIYEALERYYHKSCPQRFSHLLERLDRARDEAKAAAPEPATAASGAAPATEPATAASSGARAPAPAPEEPPATGAHTPPATPPEPQSPRPTSVPLSAEEKVALRRRQVRNVSKPLSLEEVHAALGVARSAGDIGTAMLGFLGQEFLRLLLFRVGQGKVRGWLGRSPALDEYRFRNWTVGFDEPSVFLNLRQGAEFFLGRLPAMAAHERLLHCWRGSFDTECAVFPVKVRNRLVCAIYGDRDSLGLAGLDVRMVQKLTAKAAIAFELLLMQRKLKSS